MCIRDSYETARKSMGNATVLATASSIVVAFLFYFLCEPLLRAYGASETILPYARDYLVISLFGGIVNTLQFTLNRFVLAQGMPTYSMLTNILCVGVNLSLIHISALTLRGVCAPFSRPAPTGPHKTARPPGAEFCAPLRARVRPASLACRPPPRAPYPAI